MSVISELKECQAEVSRIKGELMSLGRQKEDCFSQVKSVREQVDSLIRKIRESKEKRDTLTSAVKQLKSELGAAVAELESLGGREKELSEVMEKASRKLYGRHFNAAALKAEIARLETKMETEAVSFEKEQQLMKVLKQKKRLLADAEDLIPISSQSSEVRSGIFASKSRIRDLRIRLKQAAQESQRHHEQMIASVKELKAIRNDRKGVFDSFTALKSKYRELAIFMRKRIEALQSLRSQVAADHAASYKRSDEEKLKYIEQKQEELTEKMMKGKKLTTKDLIMFQGG